ncbi:MAG: quinoprotein relay system zinc metallohydrolase 1 [Pontibacterium sp.]
MLVTARALRSLAYLVLLGFSAVNAQATSLQYNLKPQKIAPDTWLLQGKLQDFSRKNGGNIVNTAFIVTEEGVVVFDTGPSLRYGQALKAAIASVTDQPVVHVFNSHQHPDHFLGNQAFSQATIWSLPRTGKQIAQNGHAFADNMYRMVGDWMRSTEVFLPTQPLLADEMQAGRHRLKFFTFSGHTGADLVMLDETTGVLFTADMVFFQRALTTPHTPGIAVWLEELAAISKLDYKRMVPGHGPVVDDNRAILQMQAYLQWLDKTLKSSAAQGKSMSEVMALPVPENLLAIHLSQREFQRSVVHLYPAYEEAAF